MDLSFIEYQIFLIENQKIVEDVSKIIIKNIRKIIWILFMTKKVCHVSVFEDGTGYAEAGIHTILGLDAAGVNVVGKPIKLASQYIAPPKRVQELCNADLDGVDTVIQHFLPHAFSYKGGVENIGYFYCETDNFRASGWQNYLNMMDKIWVSCKENKEACENSGVKVPINIVPIPCDPEKYKVKYEPFGFAQGRYIIYTIGDFSSRKNISNLIRCYFETFSTKDHVVLVLKTYVEGTNAQQSREIIEREIQGIKQSLRKNIANEYPPVILITDYLSKDDIMKLHATGDLFVSLERGAAWNLPAFDAMAMGNQVIVNGWGGQNQFIEHEKNGVLLDYTMSTVHGMVNCPYQNLYTCNEYWAEPYYEDCKDWMKRYYEHKPSKNDNSLTIKRFSYQNSGLNLAEAL